MVYYTPVSEKECREANRYANDDFEDNRTMKELKNDLRKALVRM